MKLGLFSIGSGRAARPEVWIRSAQKAAEVGFASLCALEHTVLFAPHACGRDFASEALAIRSCNRHNPCEG